MTLRTEYQEKVRQRNAEIYREYKKLAANPENARTAISKLLQEKYEASPTTIWRAIKQGESRKKKN